MNPQARSIQRTYLILLLGNTLAASLIWGINTLFLLDAGLSNLEAFAANAFFTAGMVIFEVPTGVVADTWGRRISYLLGTITLATSTFLYFLMWQAGGALLAVGGRLGVDRARVHLLLRRRRGVAGRCTAFRRVRRWAGDGSRPWPDGLRCGHVGRIGSRRDHRPGDHTRRAVPVARRHPFDHVRRRVPAHEGPRFHPRAGNSPAPCDPRRVQCVARARTEEPAGAMGDARGAVHRRRRRLRLLCAPAVPARALWGSQRVLGRRAGGCDCRWGTDRRWLCRTAGSAAVQEADDGADSRFRRQRGHSGVARPDQLILARAWPVGDLGVDLLGCVPDPAGLPERHDPVKTARHGAVVRLADEQQRRRGRPTCSRTRGRRLQLRDVLRDRRGDRAAGGPVPGRQPSRTGAGRRGDWRTCGVDRRASRLHAATAR